MEMHSSLFCCVIATRQTNEASQWVMDPDVSNVYCILIDFMKEFLWNIAAVCTARLSLRDPQFRRQLGIKFWMFRCLSATDSILYI